MMYRALFTISLIFLSVSNSYASNIERACIASDRQAANRPLCRCIQEVANLTLSPADQKLAAKFFDDPHRAQTVRQSNNRRHEKFWERYKTFGTSAQEFCS